MPNYGVQGFSLVVDGVGLYFYTWHEWDWSWLRNGVGMMLGYSRDILAAVLGEQRTQLLVRPPQKEVQQHEP